MKVLALESSSAVAGAAIVDDRKLIVEYTLNHKKTHSQKLMPLVEEILESAELSLDSIDVFAAAAGPGSFTGLRIGIATIKALAQAVNKPVVGIPTLDGLAYNLPFAEGLICPIMDARRDQVYTSVYRWQQDRLDRLEDYMAIPVPELLQILKQKNSPVIFNGDGVPVYRKVIEEEMGQLALFAPLTAMMQRASSIACLALEKAAAGETQHYFQLEPFYLRKSQAERLREQRMQQEG